MPDPLLSVDDLHVSFRRGAVPAVRGVSYHVDQGEFLGIVGESGSGKSVSSLAVMGLLPASAQITGSIRLGGKELLGLSDRRMSALRGSDVAMVFQDPLSALTPVFTIGRQIAEALTLHDRRLSAHAARTRAEELLRLVGLPTPARQLDRFPHELSGGMRQRVMIAMAIANDPKLIIADEPTTALDVTIQAQILDLLQKAREVTGAAVVLITHDLGVVAGNADRVAVMYAGRIVEEAPVHDLFASPVMPYTVGLLRSMPTLGAHRGARLVPLVGRPPAPGSLDAGCPFAPRCPAAEDRCRTSEPPLALVPEVGHAAACVRASEIASGQLPRGEVFPVPEAAEHVERVSAEPPVLEVSDLRRTYPLIKGRFLRQRAGTVKAVDGVSFTVRAGTTLGLVGESGCGKTTTVQQVLELAGAESGTIRVTGLNTADLSKTQRLSLRKDVQVVFQDPMAALDPRMTVADIVAEPLTVHGISPDEIERRVLAALADVGLDPSHADRYPHEFSGGQRQRIGIARALVVHPKLLVLDEPVSALDVSVQAGVINLLSDLQEQRGLSYLFVAHDLAVMRHVADDLAVMYLGRVVEHGPADALFNDPRHPYTRALLSAVPVPDPTAEARRERILLQGDLPSPLDEITGCRFAARCPLKPLLSAAQQTRCASEDPGQRSVAGRQVACHHAEQTHQLGDAAVVA
ncbi:peptide/nickel transport system ATP-binding protein [Quadrisphaera granulorum]|uniref:Peptide/nickel transport system ATP-binding protein n=1 Tax=Quadrisphaera granulorum TaxID=317664 RepID=A0A315ZRG8_9ACTN|nr:ABC transporter ATP-binding protein [Quadrisphaera granulorum]PWJ48136.1 peptide/nickel transport system ATP-binding protein [Quadrisphaera granulorum]SZE98505.1 peptide/nickel transport system ATP-binding protein [Quadrisphaera granulorum]